MHGSRPATQRRATARARRAAGAAAHGPAELALARTLRPPAGAPLAHACLAQGGAALLVATAAGALLLADLSADGLGLGTAAGTAAAAAAPAADVAGSACLAADGAAAQVGAQTAGMGAPEEAAAGPGSGAGPGPGAPPGSPDRQECPALPGDAGQGCDPAPQGSPAASGPGEDGGAGDGAPSGAAAARRAVGPGERAQGAAGEQSPWDIGDQSWALVGEACMDGGAGRAFRPLCAAFHAGGAALVDAAAHQPLLATLGADQVLRRGARARVCLRQEKQLQLHLQQKQQKGMSLRTGVTGTRHGCTSSRRRAAAPRRARRVAAAPRARVRGARARAAS